MSFEVYPSDFSTRYELRHAISMIMTIYYNDIGKLVLVAPVNDYNITAMKNGNMLYDTERNVAYIIVNTKKDTNTNRITADGYTTNWILNKRIIADKCNIGIVERDIYKMVVANTGGDKLYLPTTVGRGYVDFARGKLVVTHEYFELAISDMDMPFEEFPGWTSKSVPDVLKIIDVVGQNQNTGVPNAIGNFTDHIGCNTSGDNTASIQIYASDYGLTQSEIKKKYPNLKLQFYAPLLTPKEYDIIPTQGITPNVVYLEPTVIGSGEKSIDNPYEIIGRTNVEVPGSKTREIGRFTTGEMRYYGESANIDLTGGSLLDQIIPVLQSVEMGNRMRWDYRIEKHVFEIYKGRDLTSGIHAVIFSDEQGTARSLIINDDVSTFKNVAYVVSEFGGREITEVVGTATGDDRHEQMFEASISEEVTENENGEEIRETEEHFRQRMRTHGAMELGKRIRRQSFSVTIDPEELGVLYNIGDVVSCVSIRFGVSFNARITGVKYTLDNRKTKTEIILGEPTLTALGEMRLNG